MPFAQFLDDAYGVDPEPNTITGIGCTEVEIEVDWYVFTVKLCDTRMFWASYYLCSSSEGTIRAGCAEFYEEFGVGLDCSAQTTGL